jgi:hypothetical protein
MTDEPVKPKHPGGRPRAPKGLRGQVMNSGLTAEQEAYARARAMGMSIPEAHAAAMIHVDVSTCRTWEKKNGILINRIAELSELASKNAVLKNGLDRSWVVSRLMTVVERCMQAEQVLDKKGMPTGDYTFDSGGATRALHLLGSELGMFKDKQEKPEDSYANLSDADLTRIAQDLAIQIGISQSPEGNSAPTGSKQIIEV